MLSVNPREIPSSIRDEKSNSIQQVLIFVYNSVNFLYKLFDSIVHLSRLCESICERAAGPRKSQSKLEKCSVRGEHSAASSRNWFNVESQIKPAHFVMVEVEYGKSIFYWFSRLSWVIFPLDTDDVENKLFTRLRLLFFLFSFQVKGFPLTLECDLSTKSVPSSGKSTSNKKFHLFALHHTRLRFVGKQHK